MRAMVLRRAGERLAIEERPDARAGRRARSACGSRPAASAAPTCTWSTANCRIRSCRSFPATRSSAGSTRSARRRPAPGIARRRALARPRLRPLPLLPKRARKSLRYAALHRLHPRRRLRHPYDRRRGLRLSARRRPRSGRGGAAALRRADRLAVAQNRGRRGNRSASTASARRRTSSRRSAAGRAGGSSPSPSRRCGRAGLRPLAGRRLGRRLGRDAARPARRRDPLRPGRRARARRARARCARAGGSSAAAST